MWSIPLISLVTPAICHGWQFPSVPFVFPHGAHQILPTGSTAFRAASTGTIAASTVQLHYPVHSFQPYQRTRSLRFNQRGMAALEPPLRSSHYAPSTRSCFRTSPVYSLYRGIPFRWLLYIAHLCNQFSPSDAIISLCLRLIAHSSFHRSSTAVP